MPQLTREQQHELDRTKAELKRTKAELDDTKSILDATRQQVSCKYGQTSNCSVASVLITSILIYKFTWWYISKSNASILFYYKNGLVT